jgi:hypothetical protein
MSIVPIHACVSSYAFPTEDFPQMEPMIVRKLDTNTIPSVRARGDRFLPYTNPSGSLDMVLARLTKSTYRRSLQSSAGIRLGADKSFKASLNAPEVVQSEEGREADMKSYHSKDSLQPHFSPIRPCFAFPSHQKVDPQSVTCGPARIEKGMEKQQRVRS